MSKLDDVRSKLAHEYYETTDKSDSEVGDEMKEEFSLLDFLNSSSPRTLEAVDGIVQSVFDEQIKGQDEDKITKLLVCSSKVSRKIRVF